MNYRLTAAAIVLFALMLAAPPAVRAVDIYSVDPTHTSVVFGVGHNNLSFVYGFFKKAQGSYSLDPVNPANSQFLFVVEVNSLDTNHAQRDQHLQSAEFFDAQRHPQMKFRSTSCQRTNTPEDGIVYYVTGDMTIRGVTRQVRLPLRMLGEGEGVQKDGAKDRRTAFYCNFEVKRSDYGMSTIPIVADAVGITISFEGVLQRDSATARRPLSAPER
jgi:polyisoprenoid-binding protein YceI